MSVAYKNNTASQSQLKPPLHLTTHHCLDTPQLEEIWQALEPHGAGSPYSRRAWCTAWFHALAKHTKARPFLVTGSVQGQPVFILCLCIYHSAFGKAARWAGDTLGNQNTGLWDLDYLGSLTESLRAPLQDHLHDEGIDTLQLVNTPASIGTVPNPLFNSQDQQSPNAVYPFKLGAEPEKFIVSKRSSSSRQKLRGKRRKLEAIAPLIAKRLTTLPEQQDLVNQFIKQRFEREKLTGIPAGFTKKSHAEFLHALVRNLHTQSCGVQPALFALLHGNQVLATYIGMEANGCFYCYSLSVTSGPYLRLSPGEHLATAVIEDLCQRGMTAFDYGLGEEAYKLAWAEPEFLRDWIEPLSKRGALHCLVMKQHLKLKTALRANKRFWQAYRALRKYSKALSARLERVPFD
ncbi:GNAT family N-acetyltransferase [Flexibacterium corallicola]|uniref:GNAT family N-acetyltransferase n=1 Tax=Flexibacterium corallicola TaxID=3037259 RepID=UPI00286F89C7|nr:GNAT family N-acetyltransferase [Pseudovibrio sp. M1P-2-3]